MFQPEKGICGSATTQIIFKELSLRRILQFLVHRLVLFYSRSMCQSLINTLQRHWPMYVTMDIYRYSSFLKYEKIKREDAQKHRDFYSRACWMNGDWCQMLVSGRNWRLNRSAFAIGRSSSIVNHTAMGVHHPRSLVCQRRFLTIASLFSCREHFKFKPLVLGR